MERTVSPRKKLKSPGIDGTANINTKTSVTCANVPEGLFDANATKKHFSKFGRVQKIRLFPRKQMCIIEYDQPLAAERAVLNAGAYDGFMFDVTRTKARVRRPSKRYEDDDEDWVPDSDVQKELSAMSGAPTYRPTRQKPMEIEPEVKCHPFKLTKASPVRNKVPVREKKIIVSQPASGTESSVVMANTQTTLSTSEAAAELHQLRSRVSMTPDEQWRTLDARDRILRAWGGAGSRVQVGGATIGTCPDMCPEKELLHRQAEYQVMTLETYPDSDGQLEAWRAVKQYSRSSADQEIPMCYELRPAAVLMRTCTYLLHEIADTRRQVTLADWFHFMWDRLRGIRKDITQQALCCAESIYLVEMCARFHAHCAARLADLEHTQFDQKLNTDNLAKCLQTLKHMYADVGPEDKPREAEFRGYIALLNLGDANFLWEVKQLPQNIRKSEPITFAIQIFNALDNNNYVRFFRLVNNRATYLQACILLRYFNDVRARALARIVKAYAPRGGSRYPAEEVMNSLSFESIESMKSFINHYGLRFSKDESEVVVILDRNQFIEDMDPYPVARAINLIESKRQSTVGEVIAGGPLPSYNYNSRAPYSSFNKDGKLKDTALTAEDQQYNTINDSNKDVQGLKAEIQKIVQGGRVFANTEKLIESKIIPVVKPETRMLSPGKLFNNAIAPTNEKRPNDSFSFQPAIPVAPTEVIKNSPDKIFGSDTKNVYSFSKPQETAGSNLFVATDTGNIFKLATQGKQALFDSKPVDAIKVFGRKSNENQEPYQNPQTLFKLPEQSNIFKIPETAKAGERKSNENQDSNQNPQTLFKLPEHSNIFKIPETAKAGERKSNENQDSNQNPQTLFKLPEHSNIFKIPETAKAGERKSNENQDPNQNPQTLFKLPEHSNLFKIPESAKTGESNSNIFGNVSNKTIGNKNVFSKTKDEPHNSTTKETSVNIFAKAISTQEIPKPPSNIFGSFSKPGQLSNSNNIFAKPETDRISKPKTFSIPNGDTATNILSPGSLFKSAINADSKGYSIFQSKNKAPSVADNIFNSVNAPKTSVYDFNQNGDQTENYTQTQPLDDDRADKERERKIQEQMRHEEELKRQEEERRKEEILKQKRQEEEERRKEEERRRDEERRKQEGIKKLEEKRKREEERLQEELKKKLEEERKAEIKRKAEEEDRKFRDKVAKESAELIEELVNEVRDETVREILTEEVDKMKKLMAYADVVSEEIWTELCDEISQSEMTAEKFWTDKLKKKWFYIWRKQFARNFNRRTLLEDTPVWLTENTPVEEAVYLRRLVESSALRNMNAIHRGYKFTGEMRQLPTPESYNIMEIIKSPLLKRMKHINYPYDKCFFWKVTLISPDEKKYIYRKIELKKWLLDVFSDKKEHDSSESLIHVEKQSWNNLMNFAIAVSLTTKERRSNCGEALEGTNGLLFYATEKDHDVVVTIQETLKQKYPYQTVPIAVLLPKTVDLSTYNAIEQVLKNFANQNVISDYRIFLLDPQNIFDSLNTTTKSALKWLAKKYPQTPPLETDYLKSICQRYLGNEIWYTLKSERDTRMNTVLKNLHKLVNCYNAAVDKLTESITNEDLFNYTSFPLEFKQYLDQTSPYPKPYEFIPTNARNSENTSAIKVLMKNLKLPCPVSEFHPRSVISMQEHIRKYCNQIGWFENTEEVVCKVVATLPNEFSDLEMTSEQFNNHFEHYDLIDFLNIIVYEKINRLNTFDNRFAVYERSALENYRNSNWLYETEVLTRMKHKVLKYEDELDMFIEAKRRKIAVDSMECLMLEDKDCTMVEENIKATDESISQYTNCKEAVQQLEKQIDDERQKSIELEKMLKAALSKV